MSPRQRRQLSSSVPAPTKLSRRKTRSRFISRYTPPACQQRCTFFKEVLMAWVLTCPIRSLVNGRRSLLTGCGSEGCSQNEDPNLLCSAENRTGCSPDFYFFCGGPNWP